MLKDNVSFPDCYFKWEIQSSSGWLNVGVLVLGKEILQYCTMLAVFGGFYLVIFFVCLFLVFGFYQVYVFFKTEYYKRTIKIYASCVVNNSTFNFIIEARVPHICKMVSLVFRSWNYKVLLIQMIFKIKMIWCILSDTFKEHILILSREL